MAADPSHLTVTVDAGKSADDEDRAELVRRLRQELLEADVGSVEFAHSESIPAGAKGDPVSLSALIVSVAPAAITAVISALQVWLSRHDRTSVTIEGGGEKFTLTGTLSKDQKQMVEAFLNRHNRGAASSG